MTPEKYKYRYYRRIMNLLLYGCVIPCVVVLIISLFYIL